MNSTDPVKIFIAMIHVCSSWSTTGIRHAANVVLHLVMINLRWKGEPRTVSWLPQREHVPGHMWHWHSRQYTHDIQIWVSLHSSYFLTRYKVDTCIYTDKNKHIISLWLFWKAFYSLVVYSYLALICIYSKLHIHEF